MFDPDEWARSVNGENCLACKLLGARDDRQHVARLPSGVVRLQDDAGFRGYCILYFRRHVVELYELTADERRQLVEDLSRVAAAIAGICQPAKLNYACLGNEVPHLHWHVVPRYPTDGWWGRAFMLRPTEQRRSLVQDDLVVLSAAFNAALRS